MQSPNYRCSGDMPGAHTVCTFTCDTFEQAMDHFEATSHSVDRADYVDLNGAPLETLRAWLQRNDPNGDYTDSEEYGPFTRDDAVRNINEQLSFDRTGEPDVVIS